MKYILLLIPFILISCSTQDEIRYNKQQDKMNFCKSKGLYAVQINGSIFEDGCYTAYDSCLLKLKRTLYKFPDIKGTSSNNSDSISKTIQSEIDRCIKNL